MENFLKNPFVLTHRNFSQKLKIFSKIHFFLKNLFFLKNIFKFLSKTKIFIKNKKNSIKNHTFYVEISFF